MSRTVAERQAEYRKRRQAVGLKAVMFWLTSEAIEALERYPRAQRDRVVGQAILSYNGNVTETPDNESDRSSLAVVMKAIQALTQRVEALEGRLALRDSDVTETKLKKTQLRDSDVTDILEANVNSGKLTAEDLAREAQALHTQGLSYEQIAKRWTEEGKPALKGGHWHKGTIVKMVQRLGER